MESSRGLSRLHFGARDHLPLTSMMMCLGQLKGRQNQFATLCCSFLFLSTLFVFVFLFFFFCSQGLCITHVTSRKDYNSRADIFSFGMILAEIASRCYGTRVRELINNKGKPDDKGYLGLDPKKLWTVFPVASHHYPPSLMELAGEKPGFVLIGVLWFSTQPFFFSFVLQ